ncbi:hypothetical protein CISG_07007 [Coccidioides immitis RMSCC 3703]|uniref:Uncharacterized protein n=1 Tax=Coccidioides immitis RMSCC 3703 TaxID=454286 RepID=A0A0J8R3B2_COCIT|nr:hypothetical protein CISG_07007 [Coccidioides immitis RMSCC 3703]
MDISMDIDMDLDLGPEPEPIELDIASHPLNNGTQLEDPNILTGNEEPQFEKVHIRGVDELTTEDIKRFAAEHFQGEELSRIEWIDDTSANIVYSSTEMGLCDRAVKTDRKKHRAHEASRFYLMHPEHDPRERGGREFAERRRRGRRDDSTGDYNRRRFDEKEHRRRKGLASEEKFDESMYDDSLEPDHDETRGRRKADDLFPDHLDKSTGRLRDRSASPSRADVGNGISGPFPPARRDRNGYTRLNAGKELFGSANASSDENSGRRELFPNKTAASYLKKELFPNKTSISNHRRSDAFDAADETADLFAKRISIPLVDGAHDNGREADNRSKDNSNVELFPGGVPQTGRGLRIRGTSDDPGFSIRGSAASLNNTISIKGTASVRELFPSRYTGNEGKELFSDKLDGRGGKRRRAEDMFY